MSKSGFVGGRNEQALYENIEKLTGQRGSGLDRAITVRELHALGLVNVKRRAGGGVNVTPAPNTNDGGGVELPSQMPSAPMNLQVSGGFGSIMLTWDAPDYLGHAYTEVWRASTNDIDAATLIATVSATVFGDIVAAGSAFYYWIRHVNIKDIPGPYNDRLGVQGKTSEDIENVVDRIGEQLGASKLVKELNEKGTSAFQSMWSQKAQAEDITAGIGILADDDGTSQVAVSASQFFVFDPNSDAPMQPLFAIDQGQVIIPEAVIESATIQILESQSIVADEVRAGAFVSSPIIEGAKIRGGSAAFGVGGPFDGYHTHISDDGMLRTDNIEASGTVFGSKIEGSEIHGTDIYGATIYGGTLVQLVTKYQVEGGLEYPDGEPILAEYSLYKSISSSTNTTQYIGLYPYNNDNVVSEYRMRWSTIGSTSTSGIRVSFGGQTSSYKRGSYRVRFHYTDNDGVSRTHTTGTLNTGGVYTVAIAPGTWVIQTSVSTREVEDIRGSMPYTYNVYTLTGSIYTKSGSYTAKIDRISIISTDRIMKKVNGLSGYMSVKNYERKP
ncbi:DUF1983 domain-containing protein [Salinivibrio sp. VYel1]|uniref:phage tail tip fiber protein n=1 Tax=Salinivibrio sp. VYel1 TaxID=2490490 RepID=UPI00128BB14B|nr:DUF1983 domain-containing protein [Salinivibrio sp. VYel1]MPX91441.1 DUF1983 domain-containing protein [Salinivibrio sp. VYel1]